MNTSWKSDNATARHTNRTYDLYQQFFEHAPYGFFIAQPDAAGEIGFSLINDSAAVLLGAGMQYEYPDYATELKFVIKTIANQVDAEKTMRLEREDKLLLDGRERHFKTLLTPVYGKSSELLRVIGIIDDISLQKSREYLLALREAEFRSIAERIGTGVVRFDAHCRRIYVNPYVADAYGLAQAELLGKSPSEFPGGECGRQYEAAIREVFQTGRYVECCLEFAADERGKTCRLMLFPEWLPTGEVGSVLAIGQDQNDTREKLKLLEETQSLDVFTANSSNAVLCFNRDGACIYQNKAARQLLQEIGQISPFPAQDAEAAHPFVVEIQAAVRQVFERGEPIEKELAWATTSGHRHYRARCLPKRSLQGEITSVFAIAGEIGSTCYGKSGEDRHLTAQQEAAREDERRRIALEIHDELGQLLTALRFRLALLRPQIEAGNRLVEKGLEEILDIVDRGSREVKRITTNARPVQLGMGLQAALAELVRDFSSYTGISFEMDIEEHEPSLDETRATVLFRIVQESITNIARHSGARKAWLSMSRKLDRYYLTIADNGNGFDLSAYKQKSLGLTGIRERVMLLKGDFFIRSSPGQGTSIHISVPEQP